MSDRLSSSQTTRDFTGDYVHAPSVEVQLIIFGQSKTKADVSLYKWQPLKHECSIGITPNTFAFRVQKIPGFLGGSSEGIVADITQVQRFAYFREPTNSITTKTYGFTRRQAAVTKWENDDTSARNTPALDYTKLIGCDIWEDNVFLGRYWLCNIAQAGDDACLLIFADARYLCMRTGIVGKYIYHQSLAGWIWTYVPHCEVVFNPDNKGNKTIATSGADRNVYAFTEDWRGSNPADPTESHKWTLWEMLQYFWVQPSAPGYMHKINRPSTNDPGWALWKDYGGQQTIEVNVTGLTAVEAIDKIIKAAGEYNWTLVQRRGTGYDFDIKIIEYSKWMNYRETYTPAQAALAAQGLSYMIYPAIASLGSQTRYAMPERTFTLPTRNVPLAQSATNCVATIDISSSETSYRVLGIGEPVVIESTFSTDADYDYSCLPHGSQANTGVATLEWMGDLTAWQAAYTAATGNDIQKKKEADTVDAVAYKVCALKKMVSSSNNKINGYGFMSRDERVLWSNRRFLPYRLPEPSPTIADAADANEMPEVFVWVKRPSSDTWIFCEDINFPVQFAIDPAVGGVRFNQSMVTYDGSDFIPWDVIVVACVELDERLQVEMYRSDYDGKYVTCYAPEKYRRAERWNSMQCDMSGDLVSETVYNDWVKLQQYTNKQFAKFARLKVSGKFEIPWVERIYEVGDFIGKIYSGSSVTGASSPSTGQDFNTPVVGVDVDYQNYTTTVRTENWRQ